MAGSEVRLWIISLLIHQQLGGIHKHDRHYTALARTMDVETPIRQVPRILHGHLPQSADRVRHW
jgi:hypothetical protein